MSVHIHMKTILASICLVVVSACDRAPDVVPPMPTTTHVVQTKPRATPEEIRTGPRTKLDLVALPFSFHTPAGWEAREIEGSSLVMVQGPAPEGDVQFTLAPRTGTTPEKIKLLESGARSEMAKNSDVKLVRLRDVGSIQMLEKQSIQVTAFDPTSVDPGAPPTTSLGHTFKWTIQIFVPRRDFFETYELNFIGLTPEQFEVDKDFLDQLLTSVEYTGLAN